MLSTHEPFVTASQVIVIYHTMPVITNIHYTPCEHYCKVCMYIHECKYICMCIYSPPATDITPTLLITPSDGLHKYLPLSFNDTLSIVSTLVTTSPSRVLFIILNGTAAGGLPVNQLVVSAALLVVLSKITQLNTALVPSQTVSSAGS